MVVACSFNCFATVVVGKLEAVVVVTSELGVVVVIGRAELVDSVLLEGVIVGSLPAESRVVVDLVVVVVVEVKVG